MSVPLDGASELARRRFAQKKSIEMRDHFNYYKPVHYLAATHCHKKDLHI